MRPAHMREPQEPKEAREASKLTTLGLRLLQERYDKKVDGNQQKKRVHGLVRSLNGRADDAARGGRYRPTRNNWRDSRGGCLHEPANRSRAVRPGASARSLTPCRSGPTRAHCLLRQERRSRRLSCSHCHGKGKSIPAAGPPINVFNSFLLPGAPGAVAQRPQGRCFFGPLLLQCVLRHKACTSACSDSAQARRSRPQEGCGSPKRTIASSGGAFSTCHSEVARLSSSM